MHSRSNERFIALIWSIFIFSLISGPPAKHLGSPSKRNTMLTLNWFPEVKQFLQIYFPSALASVISASWTHIVPQRTLIIIFHFYVQGVHWILCFFQEFSKVCHLTLASTRLLLVVQNNYQLIGVTVERCRRGRDCIELWKKHKFSWTPCISCILVGLPDSATITFCINMIILLLKHFFAWGRQAVKYLFYTACPTWLVRSVRTSNSWWKIPDQYLKEQKSY